MLRSHLFLVISKIKSNFVFRKKLDSTVAHQGLLINYSLPDLENNMSTKTQLTDLLYFMKY